VNSAGKKTGKGPEEEMVTFIMTLPWMLRDVSSSKFIESVSCEFV
jgi:hypothetical protein